MLVEVTKSFRLRGQLLNVGAILDVPEKSFESLKGKAKPIGLAAAEREYYRALARFWDPATEDRPINEIRRLVDRLDLLYRMLHSQGRKVPIRLPVERTRGEEQKEAAL